MSGNNNSELIVSSISTMDMAQKIAKIGCWDHDHSANVLCWSKEQYRILGLVPDSLSPSIQLLNSLIHPHDRIGQEEAYENHLRNGTEYNIEFRLKLSDGTIKYIHSKAESDFDENSMPIRTVGTLSDITVRAERRIALEVDRNDLEVIVEDRVAELEMIVSDLKETNEELKNTQSKLVQSEKMASLGVLTAGIAHEINNPVNFIYGGITAVEENLKDVETILSAYASLDMNNAKERLPEIALAKEELQLDKALRFIKRSTVNVKSGVERTTQIIRGLRTFSRMDDASTTLSNISECIDNSLLILTSQYQDRIQITRDYVEVPRIECYPGKLSQVFVNIISNAIHAIEGQGEIIISIQKAGTERISISFSDSGSGIPDKNQSHIFEPFYTTKEVGSGTGLGLSISHGIIEQHGGAITFSSKEGNGTTFVIELPVKQNS